MNARQLIRAVRTFAITAAMALPAAGCMGGGYIAADAIDGPSRRVYDRHDAYVKADPELDQLERDVYLQTTELLRDVLDEAQAAQDR